MSAKKTWGKLLLPGLLGLGFVVGAAVAQAATFPVTITNDSPWFNPTRVSIVVGDSVKWTNISQGTHTITSLQMATPEPVGSDPAVLQFGGEFDRRACTPGCTFTQMFPKPGTFPYVCFIHPYMAGNVTVTLPGVTATGGPVPDIIQGPNTPASGLPSANGFPSGKGEVCITGDFEKPSAALPSGVVHCIDAKTFTDLPLGAFDGTSTAGIDPACFGDIGPGACIRKVAVAGPLLGRKIGGRFEGIDNAHNIWYSADGKKMFVTEWHGSNFWTFDRMTNSFMSITPVFSGADVTHVMTTLPGQAVGVLTLEGGMAGNLGIFDPATSAMVGLHSFGPVHHPHGPWISCTGAGLGGGIMIEPFPMSNFIGFTTLPGSPTAAQVMAMTDIITASPGLYPVATGALSNCTKAYTSNAVSGTITVNDVLSGAVVHVINLPACAHCTLMGAPAPHTQVPIQIPNSPDNKYIVVAMGKASQVAIIDAASDSVINVVDCGSGCHGANMGAKAGGGFYAWVSMQYQDKATVVDMDSLVKAGDVPVNVRSILTLQGLTPLGLPTAVVTAEGKWGGMGVGPFPLPPPWHLSIAGAVD